MLNFGDPGALDLANLITKIIKGTLVSVKFTETEGDKNRTIVSADKNEITVSGKALINDLTIKSTVNEDLARFVEDGALVLGNEVLGEVGHDAVLGVYLEGDVFK